MSGRLYQRNGQWFVRTKEKSTNNSLFDNKKRAAKSGVDLKPKSGNAPLQCGSPISGLNVGRLNLLAKIMDVILNKKVWINCLIGSLIGMSLAIHVVSYFVIVELKSQVGEQNKVIESIVR